MANPKPTTVLPLNATTRPFIAADVGGTHVRIGLIRPAGAGAPVKVQHYRKYACADYPSPAEIFEDFLTQLDECVQVDEAVIASAGYLLEDGSLIAANLKVGPAIAYAAYGISRGHGDATLWNPNKPFSAAVTTTPSTTSRVGDEPVILYSTGAKPARGSALKARSVT